MTSSRCSLNPASLRWRPCKPPRCAPPNFSAAPRHSALSLPASAPTSSCSLPTPSPIFTTLRKSRPSGSAGNISIAPSSTSSSPTPSTATGNPNSISPRGRTFLGNFPAIQCLRRVPLQQTGVSSFRRPHALSHPLYPDLVGALRFGFRHWGGLYRSCWRSVVGRPCVSRRHGRYPISDRPPLDRMADGYHLVRRRWRPSPRQPRFRRTSLCLTRPQSSAHRHHS